MSESQLGRKILPGRTIEDEVNPEPDLKPGLHDCFDELVIVPIFATIDP